MRPRPLPAPSRPPLWGHVDHVQELFGDRVKITKTVQPDLVVDQFPTPQHFVDFFKEDYGPTIAVYRFIAEDPERVAALDADLLALAERFDRGTDGIVLNWKYLLVIATRT